MSDIVPAQSPLAVALPDHGMSQEELNELFGDAAPLGATLPWSRINRKEGTIQIPDETGALFPVDFLEQMLIVSASSPRKMKDPDDPESGVIVCRSTDGVMPIAGGMKQGPCAICPEAQFEKNGKAPLCGQAVRFLLRDPSGVLFLMQFSGLAVKLAKTLISSFRMRNQPYFIRYIGMNLEEGADKKGRPTYFPRFVLGPATPPELVQECREIAKAYRGALRSAVDNDQAEVHSEDTGADEKTIEVKATEAQPAQPMQPVQPAQPITISTAPQAGNAQPAAAPAPVPAAAEVPITPPPAQRAANIPAQMPLAQPAASTPAQPATTASARQRRATF